MEAKGLLCQLMELSVVFMLHLFDKILSLTNSLSTYCQSKAATMTTAFTLVSSTRSVLQDMQSSDSFDKLYCAAISSCAKFGIEVDVSMPSVADDAQCIAVPESNKKRKRTGAQSTKFKDSVVLTTLGHRGSSCRNFV